jgi:hypothetical protein
MLRPKRVTQSIQATHGSGLGTRRLLMPFLTELGALGGGFSYKHKPSSANLLPDPAPAAPENVARGVSPGLTILIGTRPRGPAGVGSVSKQSQPAAAPRASKASA